jgi:hypothetical protein
VLPDLYNDWIFIPVRKSSRKYLGSLVLFKGEMDDEC